MTILISYSLTLPEDGLVGESPQVEDPVVQPLVLVHPGEVALLVLGYLPPRVLDLERQLGVATGHHPHLGHVQLHILLGAALNLVPDLLDNSLYIHDGLLGHVAGKLHHLLANLLTDKHETLHRDLLLPSLLSLGSAGVQPSPDGHCLLIQLHPEVPDVGQSGVGLRLGLVHLQWLPVNKI